MTDIDIGYLRQWIGREEGATDLVTSGLVQRFEATLGTVAHRASDAAPLAVHWCLAPPTVPPDEIGPDGHPRRGGFLPPVPLPRRMWAGGELSLHEPLRTGEEATRSSRIANVELKSGRAGNLVLVTCEHRIASGGRLTISERQDIVYREAEAAGRPTAAPASPAEARIASHTEWIEATTTLLFRYSALTFNGHRIHYDADYARTVEGYAGLVVQGPLQATMLLHLAARLKDGRAPARFSFRGIRPLFQGVSFSLNAHAADDGLELWCADQGGHETMTAKAAWQIEA